jgi:6-phosphogluconolactonase
MYTFKTALTVLALGAVASAFAQGASNQVYIETNAASGNQVQVYTQAPNGALSLSGTYATGGNGTGSGLGSQGAVTLNENGRLLYVVDAGSNDIAVFEVEGKKLRNVGNFATGGSTPISVTASGDLVYVLNAAGAGNISGFWSSGKGSLSPVAGSTRPLSGSGVGPAQIQFNPAGDTLVVTEKGTNRIDSWPVSGGVPGALTVAPSNGATPFGFDFDNSGRLFVSEAAGGAANASSASSYWLGQTGWSAISVSAPTNQTAACWLAVSPNGRFAFTANAGSGSVSGFSISSTGALTLVTPGGATGSTGAGSHPVDMGFSRNGQYLYVLANGNGTIAEFRVGTDGTLTAIGTVTGIPSSAQGLASL